MQEEEAGGGGAATVLCNGEQTDQGGRRLRQCGNDFRRRQVGHLPHADPSRHRDPAGGALVAAETAGASGKAFLIAVAAGYEVMERMAAEFIPTVMSRGFHAGPVFGIFGAAVAAAKLGGLDENQIHSAIAQCVNLAAGNLEGARSGGRSLREGGAVRNALLAVALAQARDTGRRDDARGRGRLLPRLRRQQPRRVALQLHRPDTAPISAKITEGLGRDWIFLETLYRIYSTAGYNIAHVDVTARLCEEHNITYDDIDRIEARGQLVGDRISEPGLPQPRHRGPPQVGSTQYFTAWGAAERGYPLLRGAEPGPGEIDPPAVLDLMHRVTLIPTVRCTLFGPRITVFTKDGRSFTREGTGREFIWDFEEEARRIRPIIPGLAIGEAQFVELIGTCRPPRPHRPGGGEADCADHRVVTDSRAPPLFLTCLVPSCTDRTTNLSGAGGDHGVTQEAVTHRAADQSPARDDRLVLHRARSRDPFTKPSASRSSATTTSTIGSPSSTPGRSPSASPTRRASITSPSPMPASDELTENYLRLKEIGINPHRCVNHGVTTSMYYHDPDNNQVELLVDNFATAAEGRGLYGRTLGQRQEPGRAVACQPDELVARVCAGLGSRARADQRLGQLRLREAPLT